MGANAVDVRKPVIHLLRLLLEWINQCPDTNFNQVSLKERVKKTAADIKLINKTTELAEFRIMMLVQLCALSKVVLQPSPKLLNLLYPVEGRGSMNHLLSLGVEPDYHQSTLQRILHHYGFEKFGLNAAVNSRKGCLGCIVPGTKSFSYE